MRPLLRISAIAILFASVVSSALASETSCKSIFLVPENSLKIDDEVIAAGPELDARLQKLAEQDPPPTVCLSMYPDASQSSMEFALAAIALRAKLMIEIIHIVARTDNPPPTSK